MWQRLWVSLKLAVIRVLRRWYWRYAALGDPRLLAHPTSAKRLAVPPSERRYRLIARQTGDVLLETDDPRIAKQELFAQQGVELWDGRQCRGRR